MSTYTEAEICPICGTRGTYTVSCNGDYDGPDRPREMNPNKCPGCTVLKKTSPGAYELLSSLWSKLLDERKAHREYNESREKVLYDQFDLGYPFRDDPLVWGRLAKGFRADFKRNEGITKKTGSNDLGWAWEKSTETFVYRVLRLITDAKEKSGRIANW